MSGEERLNEFIVAIDNWVELKGLPEIKLRPEIEETLNLSKEELAKLTSRECLERAYELYAYAQYLESVLAKEKITLDWAESSLLYMISDKLSQYGTQYTKWEEKYYACIKENPLASQIIKVKVHAASKVEVLEAKIPTTKKMSDVLYSLSQRR